MRGRSWKFKNKFRTPAVAFQHKIQLCVSSFDGIRCGLCGDNRIYKPTQRRVRLRSSLNTQMNDIARFQSRQRRRRERRDRMQFEGRKFARGTFLYLGYRTQRPQRGA